MCELDYGGLNLPVRMHREVATFGGADQATDRGLPFLKVLLSLRQFHDVVGSSLSGEP